MSLLVQVNGMTEHLRPQRWRCPIALGVSCNDTFAVTIQTNPTTCPYRPDLGQCARQPEEARLQCTGSPLATAIEMLKALEADVSRLCSCGGPRLLCPCSWGLAAALALPHFLYAFIWFNPAAWRRWCGTKSVDAFAACGAIGKGESVADKRCCCLRALLTAPSCWSSKAPPCQS